MKYLSIIGSTGSIGTQTLDVVSQHPDQFKVVALVAHHNIDLLEHQIKEYKPLVAGLVDEGAFKELQARYTGPTKLIGGKEALIAAQDTSGVSDTGCRRVRHGLHSAARA